MQIELIDVVQQVYAKEVALIDIRELDEWEKQHITQAFHIPLSSIQKNIQNPFPSTLKERIVYVFCASGRRVQYLLNDLDLKRYTEKEVLPLLCKFDDLFAAFGNELS
ncbi:MAG: rhodanese-like domain-containing protein [Chlamydia sp.]